MICTSVISCLSVVSQPSKCLKFMTFREVCFVIHVESKYLSEALETLYHHQFYRRWNEITSVDWIIMMRHSVNNKTSMNLVISLCSNSNLLTS